MDLLSAVAAFWALTVIVHLGSSLAALLQPWIRWRRAGFDETPPVSLITPIKENEPGLPATLDSALNQDYPAMEVIIACGAPDPAALSAARDAMAQHVEPPTRLMMGQPGLARSPKLDVLAAPIAAADNDVIFVKDSSVLLDRDQLRAFMRHLLPTTGLVATAVTGHATIGHAARVESAFLGYGARMLLAASSFGADFGNGKLMLFRRSAFLRAGGVGAIADAVAEDHAMGVALERTGLRTIIASRVARQWIGRRRLRDVWKRQLRWMICRRFIQTPSFIAEPFFAGVAAVTAAAIAAPVIGVDSWIAAAGTALFWYVVEAALVLANGWDRSALAPAAWLTRELMIPALWIRAWSTSQVVWAGTVLDVRPPRSIHPTMATRNQPN